MSFDFSATYSLNIKHKYVKPTFAGYCAVKLAERTCRRIAWIGKCHLTGKLPLGVDALKGIFGYKHLATDFQILNVNVKAQRYAHNRL